MIGIFDVRVMLGYLTFAYIPKLGPAIGEDGKHQAILIVKEWKNHSVQEIDSALPKRLSSA